MDQENEESKKCFCTRCFLPINKEDRVNIEGCNFHRFCSMCCVCRTIPTSLKMFYGHVFCNNCFKNHVMTRFNGEGPRTYSNSWWMQWAPGARPQETDTQGNNHEDKKHETPEQYIPKSPKKNICARCLTPVNDNMVEIGGQTFHQLCAKCYFCHNTPSSNVKIYYGQVFCESCFQRHVLSQNRDNPSQFFKNCFEQWQNNAQFAKDMRQFMAGNNTNVPFVFMMQDPQAPFCRCGTEPEEWFKPDEPKKSATAASVETGKESYTAHDFYFENRNTTSDIQEATTPVEELLNTENSYVTLAEKIEKLTKYVNNSVKNTSKSWKNFTRYEQPILEPRLPYGCLFQDKNIQKTKIECPKCLWQCGPVYVKSEHL